MSIMSEHGVDAFIDDDEDGTPDDTLVTDAIQRAAVLDIVPQMQERFAENFGALQNNLYLKWVNAYFAVAEVCSRRNLPVPESVAVRIGDLKRFLTLVYHGKRQLPFALEQFSWGPAVVNLNVQRGARKKPVRAVEGASTRESQPDGLKVNPDLDHYGII